VLGIAQRRDDQCAEILAHPGIDFLGRRFGKQHHQMQRRVVARNDQSRTARVDGSREQARPLSWRRRVG